MKPIPDIRDDASGGPNRDLEELAVTPGFSHVLAEPTRTEKTELAYMGRARGLMARAIEELGLAPPLDHVELATWLVTQKPHWKPATWRQNKAALAYWMKLEQHPETYEALEYLAGAGSQVPSRASSRTSSARRMKTVSDENFLRVLDATQASRSKYAMVLYMWLQVGAMCGLRPHEWTQAEVVSVPAAHAGTDTYYLRVLNSKHTNGRAHGEYRHLEFVDVSLDTIRAVSEFCQLMRNLLETGTYERTYVGCKQVLQTINANLFGRSASARWVQLYSARHRFTSIVKGTAGVNLQELAALMGHGVDDTATEHYGRSTPGIGGKSKVTPDTTRAPAREAGVGAVNPGEMAGQGHQPPAATQARLAVRPVAEEVAKVRQVFQNKRQAHRKPACGPARTDAQDFG